MDEKNPVIVEEFDIDSFDMPDETTEVDVTADAFAPYDLAPAGIYLADFKYWEKETGIRKVTYPAEGKKEERSVLQATVIVTLKRPINVPGHPDLPADRYENQMLFWRPNNSKRRDNGQSKFIALITCADPEIQSGGMQDSAVVRRVDALLRQGFEGAVEVDWSGYNPNTKKSKSGMASFPKDKNNKRIARYRDGDGTSVDGKLELVKLIPAAALLQTT